MKRPTDSVLLILLVGGLFATSGVACSTKDKDKKSDPAAAANNEAPNTAPKTTPATQPDKAAVTPPKTGAEAEPKITARLPQPEKDLAAPADTTAGETREAVFAGGCYWCVEAVYEMFDGVESVTSGYAGGTAEDANYPKVATGKTGHAEVVKVSYDPAKISYATLLRIFFATHDPTSLNKQGADAGPHYRSAVFYQSDDEKSVVQAYIDQLTAAKIYDKPLVTTLEPLDKFYDAEPDQQDYARLHPDDEYIQKNSVPLVEQAKKDFAELLKKN